jgi:hypothetical protein
MTATAVGMAGSVLSTGFGLDLISLWPGLVPAAVAALVVTLRKAWRRRFGGLPSLLALTWLGLAMAAHLQGWTPLPSSTAELTGPSTTDAVVSLEANLDGVLEVGPSALTSLYEVRFIRQGGGVGVPTARETTAGSDLTVELVDSGTTPWFRYSGWQLGLSTAPSWALDLSGRSLAADLASLSLTSLATEGEGWVRLGHVDAPASFLVRSGELEVSIPPLTPVAVTGAALVPASWEEVDGTHRSPSEGPGWTISVADGASVRIVEA